MGRAGSPLPAELLVITERRARSDAPYLQIKPVFIRVHPWLIHSGDADAQPAHQSSRRCLAVSKNFVMALASPSFTKHSNFRKSAMKAFSDFARFLRLASAMSRHISGEPDAMRVASRNPFAQSAA
jgi:hypothetical protein